jgi:hypothetical protein
MAKRSKWNPRAFHYVEPISAMKRAIILAQLGELFYKEFCSRELRKSDTPSIATRSDESHPNSERKVAHG